MTDETSDQSSPKSKKESEKESKNDSNKATNGESGKDGGVEAVKEPGAQDDSTTDAGAAAPAGTTLREPFPFARLFLTVVYGCIASFAFWLIVVLAVLQFVTIAIAGQKSDELQHFSRLMGRFIQEVFDYMTLASDIQPFPLGPFPKE